MIPLASDPFITSSPANRPLIGCAIASTCRWRPSPWKSLRPSLRRFAWPLVSSILAGPPAWWSVWCRHRIAARATESQPPKREVAPHALAVKTGEGGLRSYMLLILVQKSLITWLLVVLESRSEHWLLIFAC
jgi:hypothetical protein